LFQTATLLEFVLVKPILDSLSWTANLIQDAAIGVLLGKGSR